MDSTHNAKQKTPKGTHTIRALRLEQTIPGVFTTTVHGPDAKPVGKTTTFVLPLITPVETGNGFHLLARSKTFCFDKNINAEQFLDRARSWFEVLFNKWVNQQLDASRPEEGELIAYFDDRREFTKELLSSVHLTEPLSKDELDSLADAWDTAAGEIFDEWATQTVERGLHDAHMLLGEVN